MASKRQIEANRRNGSLGGPKTTEGKERSRANSLKHGLTSSTLVVLPEEDQQEYNEVLRGFRDSLNPEGDVEGALVLRLAQAHWRSLRSRRIETGILQVSADIQRGRARKWVENSPEHLDLHEAIGVGFMADPAERWQMYLRYDTAVSRDFFRTLDSLTKLQRVRQQQPRAAGNTTPFSEPPPPPLVSAAGGGAQLSDSGTRSVSQSEAPAATPQAASLDNVSTQQKQIEVPQRGATTSAPGRARREKRHLRRLRASARVQPHSARRATRG